MKQVSHLLAVPPLQVQVVCGVQAAVDALLIARDPAPHGPALGGRPQAELPQLAHGNHGISEGRGAGRRLLLKRQTFCAFTPRK